MINCLKNDIADINVVDNKDLCDSITKLCNLVRGNQFILEPVNDKDKSIERLFSSGGFQLYSTVKKTTLLYDPHTDYYFKILHPLTLKNKFLYSFMDKSGAIYNLMEWLHSQGVNVQRVAAYGKLKAGNRPFFAVKNADGTSLYDIMIRQKHSLSMTEYKTVINEVINLHSLGYWFGDAHLSHIFIKDGVVSGIIDIDGIRRNRPYLIKNLAKDIAGLNHPELPLTKDEKQDLFKHYINSMRGLDENKFLQLLKRYTERRWA